MSDLMGTAYFRMIEDMQLEAADRDSALATAKSVFDIADKHGADAITIKSDGELSEAGRRTRLKSLIERNDARIDSITKGPLAKLQERAGTLQASIDNQSTGKLTPEAVALHIEARKHLHELDPLDRRVMLQQLAESGECDTTLDAALMAPRAGRLVDAATAQTLRATKAARAFPEIADELDKANQTHAALRNAISTAKHSIAALTERRVLGVPDAITSAALSIGNFQVPRADAPGA